MPAKLWAGEVETHRGMNLRTKLALLTSLTALCGVSGVGFLSYNIFKEPLRKVSGKTQYEAARIFSIACKQALLYPRIGSNYMQQLKRDPVFLDIAFGYCFDSNQGIFVAHSVRAFEGKGMKEWKDSPWGRDPFAAKRYWVPIFLSKERRLAGSAVIAFSVQTERQAMRLVRRRIRQKLTVSALGILAVNVAVALLLAHLLSRPILALAEAARHIEKGDFSVRVHAEAADELGVLGRRFNEMAQGLAELDELKDHFISSVSHDLRSPLAAVRMYVSFLLDEDEARDKVLPRHREILRTVLDSTMRMGLLVTNILDSAKLKAGKMEYRFQPVAVREVVGRLFDLFGLMASKHGIELRSELPADLPPVLADPQRLELALMNLTANALKFTAPGGRVSIGARRNGRQAELWVSDTGQGIAKEDLPKLFDRFQQVGLEEQRRRGIHGTGLGLYLVKQTVDALSGSIAVESEPGKGTRFLITLPLVPGSQDA